MAKRPGVSVTSRFIAVKDQHSPLYKRKKNFASVFTKFFSIRFYYYNRISVRYNSSANSPKILSLTQQHNGYPAEKNERNIVVDERRHDRIPYVIVLSVHVQTGSRSKRRVGSWRPRITQCSGCSDQRNDRHR